jgi:hypothetical protein
MAPYGDEAPLATLERIAPIKIGRDSSMAGSSTACMASLKLENSCLRVSHNGSLRTPRWDYSQKVDQGLVTASGFSRNVMVLSTSAAHTPTNSVWALNMEGHELDLSDGPRIGREQERQATKCRLIA